MKQRTILRLLAAMLCTIIFATSCQKGDTGPAGPAGPAGPQGTTGSTGAKGDTGTANVIYSAWLDVPFTPDTIHTGNVVDTISYTGTITAAKLTSAILNQGEIKVYFNFGTTANPTVVPLPYVDIIYNGLSITPDFAVQKIYVTSNANAGTATTTAGKQFQYRYILIPGVVPGAAAGPVDWNDYKKVKEYLHLTD